MLGIIIQARMGSSRLPAKIMKPFYEGKGILQIQVEKFKKKFPNIPIIVATSNSTKDIEIVNLCENIGVISYKGHEDNVLSRFIEAAETHNLRKIIRICSDNPFIDLDSLEELIIYFKSSNKDYVSHCLLDGTPVIKSHFGLWGEGVSLSALKNTLHITHNKTYLEHVTNYIYSHPEIFNIELKKIDSQLENYKDIRLTCDTKEDFELLKEIYEKKEQNNIKNYKELLYLIRKNENWISKMHYQIIKNLK